MIWIICYLTVGLAWGLALVRGDLFRGEEERLFKLALVASTTLLWPVVLVMMGRTAARRG